MPQTPATVMVRVPPDESAGPPWGPFAFRVSMIRQGVTRNNRLAALGVFVVTVTVTVTLSAVPQPFETLTQYEVVVAGETVTLEPVAPPTCEDVSPAFPMYHLYAIVAVPQAPTLSVPV